MENLYIKNPLYPILSIVCSLVIFCVGLLISKEILIIYFLLGLTLLYLMFGYIRVLFKAIGIFVILGTIVGLGAWLTSKNMMAGIQTFGRILLLAYSSIIMVAMPPVNLTRNLVQLKVPRIITLGMLATIRFVPILFGEMKQIREAMRTRGANISLFNLSCIYRAFIIPFVMRIISMSDIMAISVETRGFDLTDKSNIVYKEIRFNSKDTAFTICFVIIIIGVVITWLGKQLG